MLIRPHDAALSEEEWTSFLSEHEFGQLIASGRGRDVPVAAPTHYALDGSRVLVHFARDNPIFEALAENPRAMLSVIGDYTYVKTDWNADASEDPAYGVPTSYYGAVQLIGPCDIVDDASGIADILTRLLARMQPEGGHAPVVPGDNAYAKQFSAIRGIVLHVEEARAKFKFGGNRSRAHRQQVAARLEERDAPHDAQARDHIARRFNFALRSGEKPARLGDSKV